MSIPRNTGFFIAFFFFALTLAQAQPGVLDASFGQGGKVVLDLPGNYAEAKSIAIQPDGKILVAGVSNPNSISHFTVVRLLSDGSLDTGFGNNGIASINFASSNSALLSDMVLLPDGKILLGGSALISFTSQLALVKLQANGLPDSTFSSDGLQTINLGSSFYVDAIGLFSDGRIVAAGSSILLGSSQTTLVRLTANGTIDNTFGGGDGIVVNEIGSNSGILDLVINANDEIFATGLTGDGTYNDALIMSFQYNGDWNTGFDSDGMKIMALDPYDDYLRRIVAMPGNTYLMCGLSNVDFALVKLNANGSANTAFSGDGIARFDLNNSFDELHGLAIDPLGHIVAAGFSGYNVYDNVVLRLQANGSLDNLFSLDGKATVDFAGGYDYTYNMAVQSDGKIVAVGSSDINSQNKMTVFRLQGVCPEISASQSLTVCQGESVVVGNTSHSTAGVYTDVITLPTGCDSTVITQLNVLPNAAVTQEVSIEGGESYTIGNSTYTTAGTYEDVLEATNGCDSVVTTILTVHLGIGNAGNSYGLLSVRPNPFDDLLMVEGTHSSDILELSDVSGKVILRIPATELETRIHTANLNPGVYWLIQRSETAPGKLRKVMKLP